MKHIIAISKILLGFFTITLIFTIINDSNLLSWEIMEWVWIFYLPVLSFLFAMIFGMDYHRKGGGIFLSFCLIAPGVLLSYFINLPWGYFFFAPCPLILSCVFSILGEACGRICRKTIEKPTK